MARDDTVDEPLIGLRDAAGRLGVHYMTAYRYVRLGVLPAEKVGGEWKVRPHDLDRVAQAQGTAPRGAGGSSWDRYLTQLLGRLGAGDEPGAWSVIEKALASGAHPRDLHVQLIGPALRTIGDRWAQGEIDIAEEHRASAVAQRLVGRLGPHFARRGRKRGTVVTGAAPGDKHSLPSAILADVLRGEGLQVIDLGADTPVRSFLETAEALDDLVAVAISIGSKETESDGSEVASTLSDALPGTAIFIGGPAVPDEERALQLGANEYGASAIDVADRCVELTRTGFRRDRSS